MPVMMTRIMKKSTITVILGVIGALYLAYKFGQTRPVDEENSERDQHLEDPVDHACSQEVRLARIEAYCKDRQDQGDTSVLRDLSTTKPVDIFVSIYAIPEKKLLMCLPFKSGSTTWQTILAKNFKTKEEAEERGFLAGKDFLAFKNTGDMTSQDVLDQYKDYYKILLTRHPIDKLESVDNALMKSPKLFNGVKNNIKKYFHPEMQVFSPYPPGTFNITDLIRYMKANFTDYERRHFTPNYYDCLPCQIKYDYMMKLETMATDQGFIVNTKMNGVASDLAVNVQRPNKDALAKGGKEIEVLRTVSDELIAFAMEYYKHDMALYGYQFNPKTRIASCMNECGNNKVCC